MENKSTTKFTIAYGSDGKPLYASVSSREPTSLVEAVKQKLDALDYQTTITCMKLGYPGDWITKWRFLDNTLRNNMAVITHNCIERTPKLTGMAEGAAKEAFGNNVVIAANVLDSILELIGAQTTTTEKQESK